MPQRAEWTLGRLRGESDKSYNGLNPLQSSAVQDEYRAENREMEMEVYHPHRM